MPTYTYKCQKCGTELEAVQKMTDPPLKRCRECRGALKRTYHPVGIVLKGPGFHRTDYASAKRKSSESSSGESSGDKSSSGESSSDKSSDTKPASPEKKKPSSAASGD